jgi:transcriptional regulator with GAF, ATPase, and Fis domain
MKTVLNLSEADRRFLADVSQLAFGNPYGDATQLVRKTLGGGDVGTHDLAHAEVRTLLEGLRNQQALSLADYAEQDRQLLHHALLFDVLHVSCKAFDAMVVAQVDKKAQVCRAPFIASLLERMTQIGMAKSVALHYVAIYYQIRRAHYYLDNVLVGSSASMQKLRHDLWNSIFTHDFALYERFLWDRMRELTTLFIGGAGVGKRAAAAAVGYCSYIPFVDKTEVFAESFISCFTPVRVAKFSGLRLESELFGHQKMAYAEALENYQGVFSRCTPAGTIFLDNILEVPSSIQAQLLGVVQDRTFAPVGDQVTREFRGRVMAAAPGNMETVRNGGLIRSDLFYHLGVNTISIPSLKQRLQENPADLELLILHILGKFTEQSPAQLVGQIIEQMHEHVGHGYDWPGNLLELEQIVKRILMVSHYESKG